MSHREVEPQTQSAPFDRALAHSIALSEDDVVSVLAFALANAAPDTVLLFVKVLRSTTFSFDRVFALALAKKYPLQLMMKKFLYHMVTLGKADLVNKLVDSPNCDVSLAASATLAKGASLLQIPEPELLTAVDWATISLIIPHMVIDPEPKQYVVLLAHPISVIRRKAVEKLSSLEKHLISEELIAHARLVLSSGEGVALMSGIRDTRLIDPMIEVVIYGSLQQSRNQALDFLSTVSCSDALFERLHTLSSGAPLSEELIKLLGRLCDPRGVPFLKRALHGPRNNAASNALGSIGGEDAIAALIEEMSRRDDPYSAMAALGRIGDSAGAAVLHAYRTQPLLRHRQGPLLARTAGLRAVEDLIRGLQDHSRSVRRSAEEGLALVGSAAIAPVLRVLNNGPSWVKPHAARILGAWRDPKTIAIVGDLVQADDRDLRLSAIHALGCFRNREGRGALSKLFHQADWRDRRAVIEALHGDANQDVTDLIELAIKDTDWRVRLAVIRWAELSLFGHKILNTLAFDSEEGVADAAQKSLTIIRAREIVSRSAYLKGDPAVQTAVPMPITDRVTFTVTGPLHTSRSARFLLFIWVHSDDDLDWVIDRARASVADKEVRVHSKGPIRIESDTLLAVHLTIESFGIALEDTVLWSGDIGNAAFPIVVPEDVAEGTHFGSASIFANGISVARVHFEINIQPFDKSKAGVRTPIDLTSREQRLRTAFASYASADRDRVLGRLQGIAKALPDLDIFVDVLSLRSGDYWETRLRGEIRTRDIFYLFWSIAARRSEWVQREWHMALEEKGLDYIDPVPLDPPDEAPPPPELAALHFNDKFLALSAAIAGR
jgi:HEAT repeat protein